MKIAYLLKEDIAKESGIVQKIEVQKRLWEQEGHTVVVFSVNASSSVSAIEGGIALENHGRGPVQKLMNLEQNARKCHRLLHAFGPDIVYTRLLIFTPSIRRILTTFPAVMEINSDDVEEKHMAGFVAGYYNMLTRGLILNAVCGIVFVTNELQKNPHFSRYKKESTVISNGTVVKPSIVDYDKCKDPTCVFIGTPNNPWHGVDKVVYLARQLPDIKFRIIGYTKDQLIALNEGENIPSNMIPYGYLDPETSHKLISESHVGIATLSLHLKKMREACPLKVRHYVACGIPVILGYYDTDLSKKESPYMLKLDNTADNISTAIVKIHKFIIECLHYKPSEVRNSLFPLVDAEKKERHRIHFITRIVSENTAS